MEEELLRKVVILRTLVVSEDGMRRLVNLPVTVLVSRALLVVIIDRLVQLSGLVVLHENYLEVLCKHLGTNLLVVKVA